MTLAAVLLFGTVSLRTSDDAEMMAAVSGYDGGTRRPELLFTSVLVGRALVRLYELIPAAPWYGLYLHGLQFLALTVMTVAACALLRDAPRAVTIAAWGSVLLVAANAMVAVQFTIVGILLALAGGTAFLALRTTGARSVLAGLAGGACLWLSFLVRVQSFGLGLLLIGMLLAVRALVIRSLDLSGWLALALVVVVLAAAAGVAESRWWSEEVGSPRPLQQFSSGLTMAPREAESDGRSDGFSENDRALIANWLIFPERTFAYDVGEPLQVLESAEEDTGDDAAWGRTLSSLLAPIGAVLSDPGGLLRSSKNVIGIGWWAMLVALAVAATGRDGRSRLGGALVLLAGILLLSAVGLTRLPDRVAVPMLLGIIVAVAVVTHEPYGALPSRDATRSPRQRMSAAVAPLLTLAIAAGPQLAAVVALSSEAAWRRDRAESFLAELGELAGETTVVLWLIDSWHAVHPLGWNEQAKYPVPTVQIAGWQSALPYREQQRVDLGIADWIGAVAEREDVLLVAHADRVTLLQTLLRERRGILCSEVDVASTVRGGRELLVRRIVPVTCQGAVIPS